MRILLTMNLPYTRAYGGANRSNRAIAEALAARGHEVLAVVPMLASPSPIGEDQWLQDLEASGVRVERGSATHSFRIAGVDVHAVRRPDDLRRSLVQKLRELEPGVVLVSAEDPSQNLLDAALRTRPGRVVYLAHTPQMFPFGPHSLYPSEARSRLLRSARAVVCISQYVAGYVREHLGVEAVVHHPPHYGAPPFPRLGDFEGYVLLMNASAIKGIDIFLGLARALPWLSFAALPGYATTPADRAALAERPNVRVLANCGSLDDVFGHTRVLLVPSLWAEGFGMAAVDAMVRGVPVLASAYAGLVEAKLETGGLVPVRPIESFEDRLDANLLPVPCVPPQDLDPWRVALARLTSDRAHYEREREAARAAALRFVEGLDIGPLEKLLLGIDRGSAASAAVVGAPDTSCPAAVDSRIQQLPKEHKAALMERLRQRARERAIVSPVPARSAIPGPAAVSGLQQQLWFFEELTPGTPTYVVPAGLQIRGPLDTDALGRALTEVAVRHDVLRTVFRNERGLPRPVVLPPAPVPLPLTDLSARPPSERAAALDAAMRTMAETSFDLGRDRLLRARLVRLGPSQHVLLLATHHIAFDGGSADILARDLAALYDAYVEGRRHGLPPVLPYAAYAAWEDGATSAEAESIAYWRRELAGNGALEFPDAQPRPKCPDPAAGYETLDIDARTTAGLRALSQELRTSLFVAVLAGFHAFLARWSGRSDVTVGTDVSMRERAEMADTIGYFVNQVAVRAAVDGASDFRSLVRSVGDRVGGALAHSTVPFHRVVQALEPPRAPGLSPLFQAKVVWNPSPPPWRLRDASVRLLRIPRRVARFDLTLFLDAKEDGIAGEVEYNSLRFAPAVVRERLHELQDLLRAVAAHPDRRLGELAERSEGPAAAPPVALNAKTGGRPSVKSFKPAPVASPRVRKSLPFGTDLPLVIEPANGGVDLPAWVRANAPEVEAGLLKHGAVLFRGFLLDPTKALEPVARVFSPRLFSENGEHPPIAPGASLYRPVFYATEKKLLWHNENSFNHRWPARIWFACKKPAEVGGETPLVDSRRVYEALDPALRDMFVRRQVLYVRNYGTGLGLHWQNVFHTSDRERVEQQCRAEGMTCRWKPGNVLETRAVRPAVILSPYTGAMSWFNQAQHWHLACLDPETRASVQALFAEQDVPRHCYFGDGGRIDDAAMTHVLEVYQRHEVVFPWRAGDILMIDNIAVAHGRNPYAGDREHLVTLGNMMTWEEASAPPDVGRAGGKGPRA